MKLKQDTTNKYDKYFIKKTGQYPYIYPSFKNLSARVQDSFGPVLDGLIANTKFHGLQITATTYNSLEVLHIYTSVGYRLEILYTPAGTLRRVRIQKNHKYAMLNSLAQLKALRDDPAAITEWINTKAEEIVQPGYTYKADKPKGE